MYGTNIFEIILIMQNPGKAEFLPEIAKFWRYKSMY